MSDFTIRPSSSADMPALDVLLRKSYGVLLAADYGPAELADALPRISQAQPRLVESGTYFVALRGSTLIGCGGWTRDVPGGAGAAQTDVAHIRHVATDPDAVRAGVGRALLHRIFDTAGAAGVRRIACYSTRTAVPFYTALGFRDLAAVDIPLGDGITFAARHMVRSL